MLLLGDSVLELDVLAFAPHPDDAEIGAGGVLAAEAAAGRRVGVIDLTRGELSSNGTVAERLQEARAASDILGLALRENLELPDGGLAGPGGLAGSGGLVSGLASTDMLAPVINAIRRHRPQIVLAPYWEDRHPDHVAACWLVTEAAYRSGLGKWPVGEGDLTDSHGPPFRPEKVLYYFINQAGQPSFVVDVSPNYERKRAALAAHLSQFQGPAAGIDQIGAAAVPTPINDPRYLGDLEARDRYFGSLIGVWYAEGFVYRGTLAVPSLSAF